MERKSTIMNNFEQGFQKQAAANGFVGLADRVRASLTKPSHVLKTKMGMGVVGAGALTYGGYKAVDKAIGAPTPQNEW